MAITIRSMQCFVAVCSTSSISRASLLLHVAQPALSLTIRRLEEDLGVALLQRSARGVTTTAAGTRFLAHAREILARIDAARTDVREHRDTLRGTVSLAMPMSIAKLLVVPLLRHGLASWPQVYLKIIESSTGYIPGFVSSGHVDIGLTFSDESSDDLRCQHLMDETLVVVSPPGSVHRVRRRSGPAALPVMRLSDVAKLPLILPGEPHSLRRLLDQYQQRAQVRFNVIAEANGIAQLIQLAAAGVGHTILSYAAVRQEAERGDVALSRVKEPAMKRPVFLCLPGSLPITMAALAVAEMVKDILHGEASDIRLA